MSVLGGVKIGVLLNGYWTITLFGVVTDATLWMRNSVYNEGKNSELNKHNVI